MEGPTSSSFVFVFLFLQKPRPFAQSFFVLRCACAPTATRSYLTTICALFCFYFFLFLFLWRCRFFQLFLYNCRFLFVWRGRRTWYVFSFWMVFFFYLVTMGWIFYISLRENSINQIKSNQILVPVPVPTYFGGVSKEGRRAFLRSYALDIFPVNASYFTRSGLLGDQLYC